MGKGRPQLPQAKFDRKAYMDKWHEEHRVESNAKALEWYHVHKDQARATQRKNAQERVEWFRTYKKTLKCERCGNDDHRVLEFHHRVAEERKFCICVGNIYHRSIESFKVEMAKCEVLCANCHNIEHYDEMLGGSKKRNVKKGKAGRPKKVVSVE